MRQMIDKDLVLEKKEISEIDIDIRCRDEMPSLLLGLQALYGDDDSREKIFKILRDIIPKKVDWNNGREGMSIWRILVLGTIRLGCNWNYDKLQDIANNHLTLRQMLGHSNFGDDKKYKLQTLKDNISLFTPEVLDKINQVIVNKGHAELGKKNEKLKGKGDSFVVKTNVHFPTDIGLLFDVIRTSMNLIFKLCDALKIKGWRKVKSNRNKIKRLMRKIQKLKHSTSKNKEKIIAKEEEIVEAHRNYIKLVGSYLDKIKASIKEIKETKMYNIAKIMQIEERIKYGEIFIDQIKRRVMEDETIPQEEKIYSIFEPHTEWIKKGKAGVYVELGKRVCIIEDQYRFILHHKVMDRITDDKIAVLIVEETKSRFENFMSCSFDKGFHSIENQIKLRELLEEVVMPKKGKLSEKDKEIEYSEDFIKTRKQHSAVESAINALENHGLDICPDHEIEGFDRYIAMAVVSRNIITLGKIIQRRELKKEKLKKNREDKLLNAA